MSTPTSSSFQGTNFSNQPLHTSGAKVKVVAGYALQQRLGSGSFATVYKGYKVTDGESSQPEGAEFVAVKAISRTSEKLTRKVLDNLELEISILRTYRHPNIVCLHDVQKTDRHFYLILEYCGGGDLQRLIRTRKSGRLTERLTRRLMRDLASGLHFLWGQELIHRDIKPQNLLLTGPLPLDELNDPAKMDIHEEARQKANFPSSKFAIKIADFGFARHLQTTSLAETLCGSPLYMAPEILQHQRYDAKADLWSVGTVLFEMIAGRPPFNGENHIDLLRNIQRKAVRLPPDVRVTKECVNLLRLLLNRNPLSRAGFKEFFHACEAFVGLGCEGVHQRNESGETTQPSMTMDLGTIHESETEDTHGAASMMTTATATHPAPQKSRNRNEPPETIPQPVQAATPVPVKRPGFVTPPFGPMTNPSAPFSSPPTSQWLSAPPQSRGAPFAPLEPSPPPTPLSPQFASASARVPSVPVLDDRPAGTPRQGLLQARTPVVADASLSGRNESSPKNSTDDSGFVMVEHGSILRNDSTSSSASGNALVVSGSDSYNKTRRDGRNKLTQSPPASPLYYGGGPMLTTKGEYLMVVNDGGNRHVPKGMLSTSPGTGGALVGMMGSANRPRLLNQSSSGSPASFESQVESAKRIIATAEDVGRRAISVAHLGDTRAYLAMRLVLSGNEEGQLLLSATPMEGVEEENGEEEETGEQSSANVTDSEDNSSSSSTQLATTVRRRRSVSTDKSMPDVTEADDENEDMPFALAVSPEPESPPKELTMHVLPPRADASSIYKSKMSEVKPAKSQPDVIRSHLGEALSCYLKALSMLKGVISAVQRVRNDLDLTGSSVSLNADQRNRMKGLVRRCDVTSNWVSGQFTGVLERADAANVEIGKLNTSHSPSSKSDARPVTTVEELIYNHALACGRDAAVKQLLGQYKVARGCYRTAGLLAETLLMEPGIGTEDRRLLEGYVDGFADRITELDRLMLEQSQSQTVSGSQGTTPKRDSSVVGIIGGIPAGIPEPPFHVK